MTAEMSNKTLDASNASENGQSENIDIDSNEKMNSSRPNPTFKKNLISGILKTTGLVMGEILPPTLSITQKHLLPDIFQSLYEIYEDTIPSRAKDWLDVFAQSIESFSIKTEKGNCLPTKLNFKRFFFYN